MFGGMADLGLIIQPLVPFAYPFNQWDPLMPQDNPIYGHRELSERGYDERV